MRPYSGNRVLVHIGLPRCASTSLQIFLADSHNYEEHACIKYPRTGVDTSRSVFGHHLTLDYDSIDPSCQLNNASLNACLLREMQVLASNSPVIISSEDFWRANPEDIRDSISSYFNISDVYIVAMKRPWLEWVASLYRHNLALMKKNKLVFSAWVKHVALEISHMRSIGRFSIYDLDRMNLFEAAFSTPIVFLPFPPSSDFLPMLAEAAGIIEVPSEWKRHHLMKSNAEPISSNITFAFETEAQLDNAYQLAEFIIYNVSSPSNPLPALDDFCKKLIMHMSRYG